MNRSMPGLPVYYQFPESTHIHVHCVSDPTYLILCRPLLLLPSIFPSIRVFSNKSALHSRWPKYWSFTFNISPSSEHPGLISFRMDWLDLLAVQGILKSLLQHHSSKASILQCSAFFIVQLSHPYLSTGKTIALTRWTFVGKVMSLLFVMLSMLVITFLPRSKHLLEKSKHFHQWNQMWLYLSRKNPRVSQENRRSGEYCVFTSVKGENKLKFIWMCLKTSGRSYKNLVSMATYTNVLLLEVAWADGK